MKTGGLIMEGRWWRFDSYEIRKGYVVPAPGATLKEYSFFEELEAMKENLEKGKRGRWDGPAPHVEFANLSDDESILLWVSRWGLLGILPHLLRQAQFSNGVIFHRHWVSGGWQVSPDTTESIEVGWNALVDRIERGSEQRGMPPGRAMMALWDGEEGVVPVEKEFERFFPGGMPKGGYPKPLSDEFWLHYGESLQDLRTVIGDLKNALVIYRSDLQDEPAFEYLSHRGQTWLNANANANTSLMAPRPGTNGETRLSASTLIGMLATLTVLGVGAKEKITLCARHGCGKVVVSSLESTAYCSDRCQNTAQQKRRRKNEATSIRLFQEGVSFDEIAKQLERDRERDAESEILSVKRWVARWLKKSGTTIQDIAAKTSTDVWTVEDWLER